METYEKKKILVFGVGGPTPRAFVKSIISSNNAKSEQFEFIGVDCNSISYGLYNKHLFIKTYKIPSANDELYWTAVNKIINENKIDAAIVLPEKEVLEWAKNSKLKLENNIKTLLPDYDLANQISNKSKLYKLLEKTDYIPKYEEIIDSKTNYEDLVLKLGNPFWLRASEGSSGLGALKIKNKNLFNSWLLINENISEFLASQFLPGRNLACKLLFKNGHLISTAACERVNYIMAKVSPSGITGNVSFARFINEPDLVNLSVKIMNYVSNKLNSSLNGMFTLDFKEDINAIPKLTEINVRYIATINCFALAGANIPLDQLEIMFDNQLHETKNYTFEMGLAFLREIDFEPIIFNELNKLE